MSKLEEERQTDILFPEPFHAALHSAGMDSIPTHLGQKQKSQITKRRLKVSMGGKAFTAVKRVAVRFPTHMMELCSNMDLLPHLDG